MTPLPGVLLIDQAGAEVGVDGHLLAGHGVQGEAGGHLGHTLGALGDDNKLHQHDNQEDDHADDDIAAGNQITEVLDNLAGVALPENLPGGGHVQSQPEQRCNQQQGRKNGKLQRVRNVHGDHEDHDRKADVDNQQKVQQLGRQWDDQK